MRTNRVQLALLALMCVAASQSILTASAQDSSENMIRVPQNSTSTPTVQLLDVQGIWNVTIAGNGMTVAISQSGDSIYGRCKFEGAVPWNGVIAGLLSGNSVNIAVSSMQGEVLVSTDITGTITDDVLSGSYVTYDGNENETGGKVSGARISPDVADYAPAKIKAKAVPEQAPTSTSSVVKQPQAVQLSQPNAVKDNQASNIRFKDVTQMARGIDPNVLPWSFPL